MASNKEILEAQRYNRRRLVTAFSSGTPGGKELESRSLFAPLLVGIVISVVMLAIAAVMGRFSPVLPNGWENSTLIVVKGTGARYFTIDGVLRPVTNITSARLLSDAGSYKTSEVSASLLEGIERGSLVGLTDVPDDVPAAQALNSDQWLSCAIHDIAHTWVAAVPDNVQPHDAAIVSNEGATFLISGGFRYEIPTQHRNGVLFALGLETLTPTPVTGQWLSLFEQGPALVPFEIHNVGASVSGMPASLATAVVGTVIEVKESSSIRRYIVTGNGRIAPLSDVAERLFRISEAGMHLGSPLSVAVADLTDVTVDTIGPVPPQWPVSISAPITSDSLPCAQLVATVEGLPVTRLVSLTQAHAEKELGVDLSTPRVLRASTIRGGSGALVRATSGGSFGAVMLVSDAGTIHGLGADPDNTLMRLGYTSDDVATIPSAWTNLLPQGTPLDPEAVWNTVREQ
ncbi:type VII secretion protein EccB [Schaalia suimastitidis]|uniref:type VII secretion protein EccB n=1 Tax=Schaalia suimastitidis TaxID=121163 RepID=UPI00042470BF|nr:type VII secretion protein EccB [Schaalia suimastitidis]